MTEPVTVTALSLCCPIAIVVRRAPAQGFWGGALKPKGMAKP